MDSLLVLGGEVQIMLSRPVNQLYVTSLRGATSPVVRTTSSLQTTLTICLSLVLLWGSESAFSMWTAEGASSADGAGIAYHPEWYREAWPSQPSELTESILVSLEPISGTSPPDGVQREGDCFFRRIHGVFRVPGTFASHNALKLGLVKPEALTILFQSDEDCIVFRYYPDYCQSWVAYRASVERLDDDRTWQTNALLATDQGRYRRSGTGSVIVFWENGSLVLARGGIRLMTVPFRGRPGEIRLAGKTLLRELRWLDGVPPPPVDRESVFPDTSPTTFFLSSVLTVNGSFPAGQQWERWGGFKDVIVQWDESGEITLAAEDAKERAYLAFPIAVKGVCDIIFRVRDASPGTGLFLADSDRRPIGGLGFYRHTQSGKLLFGFHAAQDDSWDRGVDPRKPLALTDGSQFLRITVAAGTMRYWVSADGKVWSLVEPASSNVDRRPAYCGLFITKGTQRRISLRDIYVYEGMIPLRDDLVRLTTEVPDRVLAAPDWDRWCEAVILSCPDTTTLRDWRMACAFRSIGENPPPHVGQPVLEQLWDDLLDCDGSPTEKLACSAVFARLVSLSDWGIYERLTPRLRRLAWQLAIEDANGAFTTAMDHWLRLPYWAQWRLPVFFADLYRHEMFSALGENDMEHLRQLSCCVQWAAVPGCDVVSDELRYLAQLTMSRVQSDGVGPSVPNSQVRQPLVVAATRSVYNFSREIEDALANADDQHVAHLVLLAGREETQALYQDLRDRNRWSSFSLFLRDLFATRPEVRQLVVEKGQELGKVQLRQAQSLGREDFAEQVLDRFPDTPIGAEAALWLGDRYLVLGDRTRAAAYYGRIGADAPSHVTSALLDRTTVCPSILKLVERDRRTDPEDVAVCLQDTRIIDQDVGCHLWESFRRGQSRFTLRPRFAVESPSIRRPQSLPDREFNWPKEHVTFSPFEDTLVMHAQADLRCYAWDGTFLWSQQSTVASENAVRAMVQMQPLLCSDRILGRRLTQRGSELVCLDLFDGHVIWARQVGDHVVSDPWIQDDRLYAVVITGSEFESYQLVLVCLDIRDGNIRERRPLVVLSNTLDQPVECRVVPMEHRFLVQANGCVMLFDCLGRTLWLRTFPWISPASPSWWHAQSWYAQQDPKPLIIGDQVFVSMRGGWFVASVELETGGLRWYQPVGNLLGLFAYSRGKLYLETSSGMWIMDGATGRKLGEYDWPSRAEKLVLPQFRQVITFRIRSDQRNRQRRSLYVECFRIDDGESAGAMEFPLDDRDLEWVGPVMAHLGKVYVFLARPNNPHRFEVYELVLETTNANGPHASHIGFLN
jgi:hypothetical protein